MKQAWLVTKKRIVLRDMPIPVPEPGEVVLRVEVATTCGTDLKVYRHGTHPVIKVPGPFGHEYTGVIHAIGEGVKEFNVGDPVMGANTGPCYECAECKRGRFNHCQVLFSDMVIGTYSEFVRIPKRVVKSNLFRRPEHIERKIAPLLEPLASVVHGIKQLVPLSGERGLVIGSGPLGITFSLLLQNRGVDVTLVGRNEWRNKVAFNLGIKKVYNSGGFSQRYFFDFVVDCSGNPEVWERALMYLAPRGRLLLFGGLPKGSVFRVLADEIHYKEFRLIGTFHFTPEDVGEAMDILSSGELPLDALITGEFPLKEIEIAFRMLEKGRALKFAILP